MSTYKFLICLIHYILERMLLKPYGDYMLYVSEYIPILVSKLNLRRICDPDSNNKFEGERYIEEDER